MLLLFDLGNSRCKWASADGALHAGEPVEYGADFTRKLAGVLAGATRPTRALAVSVADDTTTKQLADWLHEHFGVTLERMTARESQCGVTNRYTNPAQLGADRWAALIGARGRTSRAVCVVNCGTAVTIDAMDSAGVFQGGVILPGLATQRASLLQRTHGIRESDGQGESCLARNTADAVAAGTLHGLAGAIERVLVEQARALNALPKVFLAGGDAGLLSPLLKHEHELTPHLVLEGLQRMAAEP
jgi:type III pantothenate kinase